MFYCVHIGNSKVSNTEKFQLSLGEKMFLLNKIVCQMHPFSFYLELLFLLNFQFLGRKFQQMVATPLFLFFLEFKFKFKFVIGQNRQSNDFHWLFTTVVYQQIENSERANQIHRFTIDHCKFILIENST